MGKLRVDVHVRAPAQGVWQALTDWDGQGDWMLGTKVRSLGTQRRSAGDRLEALTGIGRVGFLDTMVVTDWVEGTEVTVAHTGRVVRGSGTFRVTPDGVHGSVVTWFEDLSIPGGRAGALAWRLAGPVSRWGVKYSLHRLAHQVESAPTRGHDPARPRH